MKIKLSYQIVILSIVAVLMAACNQAEKTKIEQLAPKSTVCYQAIAGKDTAWLKIDTSDAQFKGDFKLYNANLKRTHAGQVKGMLKVDTLKGHFDFKVNGVDKWYRNPVAFLKRGQQLTMGVGAVNIVWGSAFFDPNVPINFEEGKFIFTEVECK